MGEHSCGVTCYGKLPRYLFIVSVIKHGSRSLSNSSHRINYLLSSILAVAQPCLFRLVHIILRNLFYVIIKDVCECMQPSQGSIRATACTDYRGNSIEVEAFPAAGAIKMRETASSRRRSAE